MPFLVVGRGEGDIELGCAGGGEGVREGREGEGEGKRGTEGKGFCDKSRETVSSL